jgi:hypothetical protein
LAVLQFEIEGHMVQAVQAARRRSAPPEALHRRSAETEDWAKQALWVLLAMALVGCGLATSRTAVASSFPSPERG